MITVAAFSGLPLTNLNSSLEVTKFVNVPLVNASTTFAYSTEPACSIACFVMYTASYANAANETGTSPSYLTL